MLGWARVEHKRAAKEARGETLIFMDVDLAADLEYILDNQAGTCPRGHRHRSKKLF